MVRLLHARQALDRRVLPRVPIAPFVPVFLQFKLTKADSLPSLGHVPYRCAEGKFAHFLEYVKPKSTLLPSYPIFALSFWH